MESRPLSSSMAAGSGPFPTRTSTCPTFTSSMMSRSRKARFQGPTMAFCTRRARTCRRPGALSACLHPRAALPRRLASRCQPGVRPAVDARAARPRACPRGGAVTRAQKGGLMTTLGEPTLGTWNRRVTCSRAEIEFLSPTVLAERSTERNHLDSPAAGASIAATRSGSKRREE